MRAEKRSWYGTEKFVRETYLEEKSRRKTLVQADAPLLCDGFSRSLPQSWLPTWLSW
jgi:hypothetical protein